LALGTIAFPLLVKSKPQNQGDYQLDDKDKVAIDIFERFIDTLDFFVLPLIKKGVTIVIGIVYLESGE
jgi:hypothetical protein